jgi:CDP-diacylglycerol--glycerol-3-phosphate 3-phosphatidyltransferase
MIKFKEINTVSNYLSLLRLLLAIPFWILLDNFNSLRYILFALAIFGALTDFLDGYFARKLNQVTEIGKIIDPIADKVCIGVIITKLFLIGKIEPYYFYMIIGRDLLIFLGGILLTRKLGKVLPSNMLGKITVFVIGIFILLIMIGIESGTIFYKIIYYASQLLIVGSFIGYALRASEFVKGNKYGSV